MKVYVGVDEAGRGCVIGPLFVAAAAFTEEALNHLREAGVKDSKKLARRRREGLEPLVRQLAAAVVVERVDPSTIDSRNLNEAELDAVSTALRRLASRLRELKAVVERVSIDLFGREEELRRVVEEAFPGVEARLLHDADASLIECSAASIIAKVERDRFIDLLKRNYGDFGSGYPSDPKTRRWLSTIATLGEPPPCVRRSWRTLLKHAPELYVDKRRGSG